MIKQSSTGNAMNDWSIIMLFCWVAGSVLQLPANGECRVMSKTNIVTGYVATVSPEGTIALENGEKFCPPSGRKKMLSHIQTGSTITIRYIHRDGKNVYVELATKGDRLQKQPALPSGAPKKAY